MNPNIFPDFELSHLYVEQITVLQNGPQGYGRIVALSPITPDGVYDDSRPSIFLGHTLLIGQGTDGQTHQIPIQFMFPPEIDSPVAAIYSFKTYALKAVEEFEARSFRNAIVDPGKN